MSGALRYALALLAAIAIVGAPAVARAALLAPATADVVLVTRIVRVSDGDTVHADLPEQSNAPSQTLH